MSKRRDARRLAMQVLYQIDATGETDAEVIFDGLDADHDPAPVRTEAVDLALAAWANHEETDVKVTALAEDWPTHRQPPVDRAILRLAVHEMTIGRVPPKVAINEALDLAKQFSNENAPAFINGILDKVRKSLDLPEPASPPEKPAAPENASEWLDDARSNG